MYGQLLMIYNELYVMVVAPNKNDARKVRERPATWMFVIRSNVGL